MISYEPTMNKNTISVSDNISSGQNKYVSKRIGYMYFVHS